jgi:hypothetical protein
VKTRNFYLNIDEDKIFFESIRFNEDSNIPEEEFQLSLFDCLSMSPSVIDISKIGYLPKIGDVWNGTDFVGESGISTKEQPFMAEKHYSFSFLVDNAHRLFLSYPGDEESNMKIAALKSNPTITFEDVND